MRKHELVISLTTEAMLDRRAGVDVPDIDELLEGINYSTLAGDADAALTISVSEKAVDRVRTAVAEYCVVEDLYELELLSKQRA